MTNNLQPLEEPFAPEVDEILASYPQQDGYLLALFRTFANSVRFLRKGVPNLLDKDSPLDLRSREITILRTTSNRNCEYEWGVHVAIFAEAAGLDQNQIEATRFNHPQSWSDKEHRLIRAIDQLCAGANLDDNLRDQFQADWTPAQQLEIMALVGTYSTVSYVANTSQLALEPFGVRFPGNTSDEEAERVTS